MFLTLGFSGTASADDLHVDCSAPVAGTGTPAEPVNSIASAFDLGAGDRLLLRRGTTCSGELRLRGGGTASSPATVTAYGTGALPEIVGTGRDAVRVEDASHLTVGDLDVSNPGSGEPLGEATEIRNGIRVTSQTGVSTGVTLSGLEIHDVAGDLTKNPEGSAAIQISATGPPPARFVDLRITGNRITSVSRSAISITGTNDSDRPPADRPWPEASTGVRVDGNRIDLVAGDGIVPRGTDGALVEGNVVSRGNLAGRPLLDPAGAMCNAGIWAFHANNTVIRGNEVFGMEHNGCDGTGFDIDYRQDGTIVEGNYSHGNEGGFVLLCTDEVARTAEVRFNLSVDDGTMINHGPCGVTSGILGDLSGIRMYNNTVVGRTPTVSVQLGEMTEMYAPGDFRFENNLVYARASTDGIPCGENCSNNAFFNLPASGAAAVVGDPRLAGPLDGGESMAVAEGFGLEWDSPLIGAGVAVPAGGVTDFFGDPIPAVPAVGFDQTPTIRPPAPKPGAACLKARKLRARAVGKARALNRKVRKLRRRGAPRKRIRPVVRRMKKARAQAKRQASAIRRTCPPATAG